MQFKLKSIYLCLLLGLTLPIIARTSRPVHAQATADAQPLLSVEALSNATYQSAYAKGGKVTLNNGQYIAAAGTIDEMHVTLTGYLPTAT